MDLVDINKFSINLETDIGKEKLLKYLKREIDYRRKTNRKSCLSHLFSSAVHFLIIKKRLIRSSKSINFRIVDQNIRIS